jgi:hypothetical protein
MKLRILNLLSNEEMNEFEQGDVDAYIMVQKVRTS